MRIQKLLTEKKEWRAFKARTKRLPEEYQIVYQEIEKYLFKVGPVNLTNSDGILVEIVELFEQGVQANQKVLAVTGPDVAAFVDELIGDEPTFTDGLQKRDPQDIPPTENDWVSKK